MNPAKWLFPTLLVINLFCFSTSIDSLTSTNSIKDGDVLVSSRKIFALGFFSPRDSTRRYVGIWYNQISEQTIVWVANRNNPVYGKSGVLSIDDHGDIILSERNRTDVVWSTRDPRVFRKNYTNSIARLLDTGNLVLFQNDAKKMLLWQSFDYPTNTMLPFMKLGLDRPTRLNRFLTSWKSPDDPGFGNYSYRIDPSGFPQLSLYKGSVKWWRTGSWTGQRWSGVPEMTNNYIFNVTYINDSKEVSIMYGITDPTVLSRMVVNETGFQQRYTWNNQNRRWIGFWSAPKEQCDHYGHCGINSNCSPYHEDVYECTCLPGFEPRNPQEWYLRDGSDGCVRKRGMSMCQRGEGFVKVRHVKVPDTSIARVDMSLDLKACKNMCLRNCSCMAYTSTYYEKNGGVGCMTYYGDMLDTRTYTNAGQDLYIRVDARELAKYAKNGSLGKKGTAGIVVASIAILLLAISIFWFLARKKKATEKARKRKLPFSSTYLGDSFGRKDQDELQLYDLNTIATATNNFSDDHKLGEGGFGSVYKGVLYNGKQIAVKRLSKCSGQGIEEFRNEVTLIAKLQHRNLVRILGCCIEAGEKMLVYEFLPNKSLDTFIFRETNKSLLDWRKRFDIICGIARGILYLHQDSRLRIIHRDLKASNVLLDDAMNPKIADFGMARIFGGDQVEANTNRVVGTYGYMSPEYAMEGLFSIKSDVYSFGVLLLEIITGKKNSGFFLEDIASANLIGHVWDLWKVDRATEMVDESLGESYPADEVSRCIQIGLLCVQEHATDRPTMTTVVNILSVDSVLPFPKKPAFIERRKGGGDNSNTGASEEASSVNEVTMTMFQGR